MITTGRDSGPTSWINLHSVDISLLLTDSEAPIIDFCQSPPVFLTNNGENVAGNVEWDEPIFHDNSKDPIKINKTHGFGDFPLGSTKVTYVATDSSGNQATCDLTIEVQG